MKVGNNHLHAIMLTGLETVGSDRHHRLGAAAMVKNGGPRWPIQSLDQSQKSKVARRNSRY